MATFRLRYFSQPHVLRAIEPARLLAFLEPYRTFFSARGYDLPADADEEIDYQQLVDIFMTPDEATPQDLLDALFLVDEMSTPEGMDQLLDAADRARLVLEDGEDQSHTDIAIQIWLLDREILERKHAEQFLFKPKSFEYYQTVHEEPPRFRSPSRQTLHRLERELDNWFEKKRRGRGARVFVYADEHEVRFLVRHGEPFHRVESLAGAEVCSVCYRPLKYDVLVYDRRLGELRINARLVGEKKLYRRLFGRHLFADENCFPDTATSKYTLEPLREYGADALSCGDVDGIESIRLTEVQYLWGGAQGEIEVRKAKDVFAALASRRREMPESPRIVKGVFKVEFSDSRAPRSVELRPPNVAKYTRDSDAALVEAWLGLRGFIIHQEVTEDESAPRALAGS